MKIKTKRDLEYFEWLTSQIEIPAGNHNTYYDLFERLHETEFVWIVQGDDNRIMDAMDLRSEFIRGWKAARRPVSVLELLIGVSRRTEWVAGGTAPQWAWVLLKNLRLTKASDPWNGAKARRVDEILENFIWRTYESDGQGGFFPLRFPNVDQRQLEIWYQMQAYAIELAA
jgi:hypothetical protein